MVVVVVVVFLLIMLDCGAISQGKADNICKPTVLLREDEVVDMVSREARII